jgi:quercetin dioxygenase-like cupin family protein
MLDHAHAVRRADLPVHEPAPGASVQMLTGEDHGLGVCVVMGHYPPGVGPGAHRHPEASVIYVAAGRGNFTVDDTEVLAEAGDVVVIPAMAWHSFVNVGHDWLRVVGVDQGARAEVEFSPSDVPLI